MIDRKQDMPDAELEALYREAGDVEPRPGLDRMIRARAEEASRNRHVSRRLPWLGGLATASVAIVAIAVVMQQTPPGESTSEAIGPTELREPKAFMAPSVGAPAEQEKSGQAGRARAESRTPQPSASARSDTDGTRRDAVPVPDAETQADHAQTDRIYGEQADIMTAPNRAVPAKIADDPDAMLAEIRELLDAGKTGQAHEWLERLRSTHPDHVVPEDIEQALEEETSDR